MRSLEPAKAREVLRDLTRLAVRHTVQGLVFQNLHESLAREAGWEAVRKEIEASLSLIKRQAAFWDLEQVRVLAGLERAEIRPLVLKGGALRGWVFESPVERAMGDLDILVRREEVREVLDVLELLGYRSGYTADAREGFREHLYHDRVTHANGFHVEVHWALTRPDALMKLDGELFQERAALRSRDGSPPLRVPSPEDMVLHTISQSEQDGLRKLRRMVDLDRLLRSQDLDWAYLSAESARSGLSAAMAVALRISNLCFATPAPDVLLEGRTLAPVPRRAITVLRPLRRLLRESRRAMVPDHYLFRLWCTQGWAKRWQWVKRIASGRIDPLGWVWEEEQESEVTEKGRFWGFWLLLKIMVLQSALLVAALPSPLRGDLRRELGFWKTRNRRGTRLQA